MKKEETAPFRMNSLAEAHRAFGLPQPRHPLISMVNGAEGNTGMFSLYSRPHVLGFYKISYKPRLGGRLKYGQTWYDFDEGGLLFAAPGQVVGGDAQDGSVCSEFTLLIHPDFFLGHPIAKKIRQFGFFSYSTNETLHLSEEEKTTVMAIFRMIENELNSRIDDFSQDVSIAQIELLFNYANRFYKRQFITRKTVHNELLQKLEGLLDEYFKEDRALQQGIPTVQYLAERLNMTPGYLSDMLRSLTGRSAQQHIHDRLIETAKETLSTTTLSVSEVAYLLGFEHSQSFNRLFKSKTSLSPLAFRRSFN